VIADRHSPAGIARDLKRGNSLYLYRPDRDDESLRAELQRLTGLAVTVRRSSDWLAVEASKAPAPTMFPTPVEDLP
jgi:hypothetical protein